MCKDARNRVLLFILWNILYFSLFQFFELGHLIQHLVILIGSLKLTNYIKMSQKPLVRGSLFISWFLFFQTGLFLLLEIGKRISHEMTSFSVIKLVGYSFLFILVSLIKLKNLDEMMRWLKQILYNHFHLGVLTSAVLFVSAVLLYLNWFNLSQWPFIEGNLSKKLKGLEMILTSEATKFIFTTHLLLILSFFLYYGIKKFISKGEVVSENTHR